MRKINTDPHTKNVLSVAGRVNWFFSGWGYIIIFLIPLFLVKVSIFGLPTNLLEVIFGIVFIFWVFQRWREIKIKEFYENYKKYILSAGLIIIGIIISAVFNGNNPHSWGIIKSWFLIPMIFMLITADIISREKATPYTKKTKDNFDGGVNIFWAYYLSAFFVALIALGCLFLGKITFDGRLQAIFNSPNYLAMYLAPALIMALAQFQISNFKFQINTKYQSLKLKNIFFAISLLVILIVFYFTYSYAAWISVIISLLILFFIQKKISFRKIIIISAIFILLIFSQMKDEKFNDLMSIDSRSSLASRMMIWKSAGKILKDNWLLGIGPGNFQDKYLEYQKFYLPYLEWAVPHPHNLYLAFWLYGGIAGIFGFLVLIFFYFQDILEKIRKAQNTEVLCISLAIMLYILIHGLVDTTYFKNDLAIVFWLSFIALKIHIRTN